MTSINSEEDIEKYIENSISQISQDGVLEDWAKDYKIGSLLYGAGRHREAVDYLERSFDGLSKLKDSVIYRDAFCSVGAMYAGILDYLGENDLSGAVFQMLMDVNPKGHHVGDYAAFMHRRKKDHKKADSLYAKAIELFPNDSSILLKFAGFVRHVRKDKRESIEALYKASCDANKGNADALGNYASYLHGLGEKTSKCRELYEAAVKADKTHANNYCNYGLYLSEECKEYEHAERLYSQALNVAPTHSNTLYNYAVMLDTHCSRKPEAEQLYRRAIEVDPKHSFALYNLAVLLEEIAIDRSGEEGHKEIATLYKRATEADPRDAAAAADYGRFILVRFSDEENAENALKRALALDGQNEVALYNMGLLYYKYKQPSNLPKLKISLSMFRKLLEKNSSHCSGALQLARLIVEMNAIEEGVTEKESIPTIVNGKEVIKAWLEEAIELYEVAINKHKEPAAIVSEYAKVVSKCGSARQKMRAIATTESFFRATKRTETEFDKDLMKIINALKA